MDLGLSDAAQSWLALLGALAGVAALITAVLAIRRRSPVMPPLEDRELRRELEVRDKAIHDLEQAARVLYANDRRQQAYAERRLGRVDLVRFDAFEDVGGRLSFSCAILDDHGDGVVVTSINGRRDTRVYAKPVRGGASTFTLSAEEAEAIDRAMGGGRAAE